MVALRRQYGELDFTVTANCEFLAFAAAEYAIARLGISADLIIRWRYALGGNTRCGTLSDHQGSNAVHRFPSVHNKCGLHGKVHIEGARQIIDNFITFKRHRYSDVDLRGVGNSG